MEPDTDPVEVPGGELLVNDDLEHLRRLVGRAVGRCGGQQPDVVAPLEVVHHRIDPPLGWHDPLRPVLRGDRHVQASRGGEHAPLPTQS